MRIITLVAFFLVFFSTSISAQLISRAKIENIEAILVDDKIEVNFSIKNAAIDEYVDIELKFKNGNNYIYPKTINGPTKALSNGFYTIIWDVLEDMDDLSGKIKPIISIIETTHKIDMHNAFVPGFNRVDKIIATVSYTCIATGAVQFFRGKSLYDKYLNELGSSDDRKNYYDKAIFAQKSSKILIGTGIGLLATNIILTRLYNKKFNLAAITFDNGGLCLKFTHTFHF